MLKFLIISFLVFFLIYKLLGFFFRMLIRGSASQYQQQQHQYKNSNQNRKPSDGNVNIDYIPEDRSKKVKSKADPNYQGGEYIDYEEVK